MERLTEGESHTFVVLGKPAPGGSKTAIMTGSGKFGVRPANKRTKPWMKLCQATFRADWGDYDPIDAPFAVEVNFIFEPPKKAGPNDWPLTSGDDLDKLLRATLDPLAGVKEKGEVVWRGAIANDRRIVRIVAERHFGSPERAEVTIIRLPRQRLVDEAAVGAQEALPV